MRAFLLFIYFFVNALAYYCPKSSDQIPGENRCVYSVVTLQTQSTAKYGCQVLNSELAKITTTFENNFVSKKLTDSNFSDTYIGIEKGPGQWVYSDGSPLLYQAWAKGQPDTNDRSFSCVVMDHSSGLWKTADCKQARPSFCSYDSTTDKRCPQGWQYYDGTDSCYWLRDFTHDQGYWKLVDYQLADEGCKKMSAQLVSIHSKEEDDFVYDLISSYVGNMTNVVVNNGNPCAYLMVWSGLYSKGAINDGWWSDGTPVDYLGIGVYPMGLGYQWLLRNDRSCGRAEWEPNNPDRYFARYVCKIRSQ